MNIVFHHIGRNINRVMRLCYSFGIYQIYIIGDKYKTYHKKNLFSANGKVNIVNIDNSFLNENFVAFENHYSNSFFSFNNWEDISGIVIGGESCSVPKLNYKYKIKIPTVNSLCLTIESCLSIILYEWSKKNDKI